MLIGSLLILAGSYVLLERVDAYMRFGDKLSKRQTARQIQDAEPAPEEQKEKTPATTV